MAVTIFQQLKNGLWNLLPELILDYYMRWRLPFEKYRAFRISRYEKNYDGSIIKLGRNYYRLHKHESVSRNLYADKIFSGDIVNFLGKLMPIFGSFIDVGANIGSITVPTISRYALPSLAVEPVADNYKLLKENLRLNGLEKQVKTLQAAVGDSEGVTQIYLSPNNSGDHRINRKDNEERKSEQVSLYTLDKCLREYDELKPPYLIKVDVQGYETYVIRGAQSMVQSPCAFVIELWPWGLETNGSNVTELEEAYQRLKLQAYVLRFNGSDLKLEEVMNLQDIADEIPDEWGAHVELLITNQNLEKLGLSSLLI